MLFHEDIGKFKNELGYVYDKFFQGYESRFDETDVSSNGTAEEEL
jgi:hypothetical protein